MEMAFNPLHMFRKRQKVMLAILTIGTMFLFVLGSGIKGDFFSRDWFGGRNRNDLYLKKTDGSEFEMNGKPVSATDLAQLRLERRMAYAYLMWAHQQEFQKLLTEWQSYQKISPTDVEAM